MLLVLEAERVEPDVRAFDGVAAASLGVSVAFDVREPFTGSTRAWMCGGRTARKAVALRVAFACVVPGPAGLRAFTLAPALTALVPAGGYVDGVVELRVTGGRRMHFPVEVAPFEATSDFCVPGFVA